MNELKTEATEFSPDYATCQHCRAQIMWDEDGLCYVHCSDGFADCGVVMTAGTIGRSLKRSWLAINPKLSINPVFEGKRAEPTTWFDDEGNELPQ